VTRKWAALFVTGTVAIASAQSTGSASGGQSNTQTPPPAQSSGQANGQAHPRRVVAKLDGFDLAPEAASPNQIGGASRGGAPSQKLVANAPRKGRIFTLRPSFSWQGASATAYKFHIQDVTGQFVWERQVTGTSLDYPSDAPPLEAGKTYIWRVYPDSPMIGGATPQAMIVVLSEQERAQIETAQNDISGTGLDADMARAHLYFDRRLWYDAVMAYSDLIEKHPGEAKLYLMRGSLYAQLPATEPLADKDFARAE
jgi:Domain of Unknown Function (DUF928)